MKLKLLFSFVVTVFLAANVFAQIPAGYYDSAQGLSGTQLKTALYDIIKGHTEYPYSSNGTDTWDILKEADKDPNNANNVIGIYSGFSMNAALEYNEGNGWSREHVWAQSRGGLGTSAGPGTDCHHLRAEDVSTNSARSNRNFAASTTQYIDASGEYAGTTQSYMGPDYTWEPRDEVKGDVARMIFYMATRYEGEFGEPDLELTESLLSQGDTSPLHGRLSDLLLWHAQDPVDSAEMNRNDIIYGYQNNRNPFIDHPEYVTSIWGPPPSSVPYFTSSAVTTATEDAAYLYNVTTEGGQGARTLSASTLPSWLMFSDSGSGNGTVSGTPTAIDIGSHNVVLEVTDGVDITIQNFTIIVSAAGGGGSGGSDVVFINEIHYDNSGSDQGEGVELVGSAGMDISGWTLVFYNGSGGASYKTTNLSGVFTDQNNGVGFLNFAISGIQNGAPDAIALVDNAGSVVQFLSYEGALTATDGPANGMLSTDIGVSETSGTSVGHSLQLSGMGSDYTDFSWVSAATSTFGALNNGQTFTGGPPPNQDPSVSVTSPLNGNDYSSLATVDINANASDPDGTVTQVEFFINGISLGVDNTSPYSMSWVIPDWGAYAITAVAMDDDSATTTSATINVTATQPPNQDPVVNITSPLNGTDYTSLDTVDITADASDTDGSVTQVEFFVDGISLGTDTTAPYSISWVIPAWGAHAITAVATDDDAATTTSATINVTATQPPNQDPVVNITSPLNGTDYTSLDTVDITADASDTDGSVTQVEFFVDGISVGTDATAPYSISWVIPAWGAHAITAVATDDDAATTTSATINVTATDTAAPVTVFINEIHYDNESADQGEGVELAGTAGADLTGWSLILYNGSNGTAYNTTNLSGVFSNQANGVGFISFNISGIQNGGPDGVALVDDTGSVVQFLSYEGAFTATDGPANGMQSTDIGVSETTGTPVGYSLQLSGTGSTYSDFSWASAATDTFGALNNGQSFGGAPPNQAPAVSITSPLDGTDYTSLDTVDITADASDTDGSVTQVEFFVDGISLGTDTTAPYSISWVIPAWGAYAITAVATDDDTATTTSAAVNVTATDPAPPGGISIEHGTVSNVDSNWQVVNLQNTYASMVVVATVHLPNSAAPAVSRVRNASGSSFEVKVQSPSGAVLNGYSIQYLVVEEGVYTAGADGVTMEAVKVTSTATARRNNWVFENRSYQNAYTNPVVIGQVMTANDADWSVFWASSAGSRTSPPNASGFSAGKHVGEDPNTSRANETLGYIVIEAGSGTINGVEYAAGTGADTVRGVGNNASGYTYNIAGISAASEAMLSAAAMDGNDGGWPVLTTATPVSGSAIQLVYDEDQVNDSERKHTTEQVAYLVVGSSVSAKSAVKTEEPLLTDTEPTVEEVETRISSYPNPFTSRITIDIVAGFTGEVEIEIYDSLGRRVYAQTHYKEETDARITIETASLRTGLYILRTRFADKLITKNLIKR